MPNFSFHYWLKYIFNEDSEKIETSAAIVNSSSWNLMEKLGFKRQKTTHYTKYTLIEDDVEVYEYHLTISVPVESYDDNMINKIDHIYNSYQIL